MKRTKWTTTLCILLTICLLTQSATLTQAYGEIVINKEVSPSLSFTATKEYQNWLSSWQAKNMSDTANITLTPGSTERDLQFSWYAKTAGQPAVMIADNSDFTNYKIILGTSKSIRQSNGYTLYTTYNNVSITNFFSENTTYYYRYTDNISNPSVTWSETYSYRTSSANSYTALLVGDAQIGASNNIATDTYSWNHTLSKTASIVSNPAFLLSAGDQINAKTDDNISGLRESQYAGFLYPNKLRQLPIAAAIGNHETKGTDYKYHFNNPNDSKNYGSTPSGCDYFFSYGNAVFIVLNSNSRALSNHRQCMQQAIVQNPNATWRIVMFHHDIYGSGAPHSNLTSTNIRTILAPLMDEFHVDLVFSGHDHSYARSYPMLDGTAIKTASTKLTDPYGTVYVSLGSSTGSKMYNLAPKKQFYVAERSNNLQATFSTLQVTKQMLTLKTYDSDGKSYANDLIIQKTKKKESPVEIQKQCSALKKKNYTIASWKKLNAAMTKYTQIMKPTKTDSGAVKIEKYYGKAKDPLSYYGYAAHTTKALPNGFSTLLDKTRLQCVTTSVNKLDSAYQNLLTAKKRLVKTTMTVRKKGSTKKLKNKATISLKKNHSLKLKVSVSPTKYKVTYLSNAKKYVTVSKKGVVKVKRVRKKPVTITIRFQNRTQYLKIRTKK